MGQSKKAAHPYVKRAGWVGVFVGATLFYNQHQELGMAPLASLLFGGLLGLLAGSILGTFVVDEGGHIKGLFSAVGGLCGAVIGLAAAGHGEADWTVALIVTVVSTAIGAAIGKRVWWLLAVVAALLLAYGPGLVRLST